MKNLLTTALIATTFASPVRGDLVAPQTVQQFFEVCPTLRSNDLVDDEDFNQASMCMGVVVGISSLMDLNCQLGRGDTPNHLKADLAGGDASLSAVKQAMWNYAEDNPSLWSLPVGMLLAALAEEWPCVQ